MDGSITPPKTPFFVKILIPREELRKMGVFKAFLRFKKGIKQFPRKVTRW